MKHHIARGLRVLIYIEHSKGPRLGVATRDLERTLRFLSYVSFSADPMYTRRLVRYHPFPQLPPPRVQMRSLQITFFQAIDFARLQLVRLFLMTS